MVHVMIFLLVLSLGFGIGSIAISVRLYGIYRTDFIRYLILFLVSLNVAALLGVFYNYAGENLQASVSPGVIAGIDTGYRLTASLVLTGIAGSLIYMLRSLINEKPSRLYLGILALVWIFLMAIFLAGIDAAIDSVRLPVPVLINIIIDQLVQYIVLIECIRAYRHSAAITDRIARTATQQLLGVFGAIWLFLILISALLLMGELANKIFNLISGILYILFNALPLLLLKPFMRACYGEAQNITGAPARSMDSLEALRERYGISPRELEIISLICKGYSNKKIAEELFISISTVKDHNQHIYRKLDIRSRTQLVSLFTSHNW